MYIWVLLFISKKIKEIYDGVFLKYPHDEYESPRCMEMNFQCLWVRTLTVKMDFPYDIWAVINDYVGFRMNLFFIRTIGEISNHAWKQIGFEPFGVGDHVCARDLCQQNYLFVVADLSRIFRYFQRPHNVLKFMRACRLMYNDGGDTPRMACDNFYVDKRHRNIDRVYNEWARKLKISLYV
jgi:hypothetical protein